MYIRADDWKSAHRVAIGCMPTEEIRELYMSQVYILLPQIPLSILSKRGFTYTYACIGLGCSAGERV